MRKLLILALISCAGVAMINADYNSPYSQTNPSGWICCEHHARGTASKMTFDDCNNLSVNHKGSEVDQSRCS